MMANAFGPGSATTEEHLIRMRTLAFVAIASVTTIIAFAQHNHPLFDGKSWWAHVSVLASDKMEGRGTGAAGLERAAAYIVDQLKSDGLQPAARSRPPTGDPIAGRHHSPMIFISTRFRRLPSNSK